jgi:hypothetical protein
MYTDKEVKEILDRVYSEAYDAGIDDTLEYFEENYELDSDDSFDLMDEYDSYTESNAVTKARNREIAKRAFKKRLEDEKGGGTAKYYYNKGGSGNIQPEGNRYYQGGERGRLNNNIRLNHNLLKDGDISAKDLARSYKYDRYNRKNDHDKLPK